MKQISNRYFKPGDKIFFLGCIFLVKFEFINCCGSFNARMIKLLLSFVHVLGLKV